MAVDLSLINGALSRTGNDPITDLASPGAGAKIAANNYERLIKSLISKGRFKWATKTGQLDRIAGTPAPPWTAAYQLPPDLLELRIVQSAGNNVTYELQTNKILCDADVSETIIAKYLYRVSETAMPEAFAEAVIVYLEAMFLRGIGERYQEAELRTKAAKEAFQEAKRLDAQSQTPRNPDVSATLAARGGVVDTSRRPQAITLQG